MHQRIHVDFQRAGEFCAAGFTIPHRRIPHSSAGADNIFQVAPLVVQEVEAILHGCTKKGQMLQLIVFGHFKSS